MSDGNRLLTDGFATLVGRVLVTDGRARTTYFTTGSTKARGENSIVFYLSHWLLISLPLG